MRRAWAAAEARAERALSRLHKGSEEFRRRYPEEWDNKQPPPFDSDSEGNGDPDGGPNEGPRQQEGGCREREEVISIGDSTDSEWHVAEGTDEGQNMEQRDCISIASSAVRLVLEPLAVTRDASKCRL